MGERIGLTDEEWALIGPLFPAERGRGCRPAQDNRRYFEGMMWMARTGAPWRHLPDEYGKWNSVFRRFRRWVETGVFEAMLETLSEMVEWDRSTDMIDSNAGRGTAVLAESRPAASLCPYQGGHVRLGQSGRAKRIISARKTPTIQVRVSGPGSTITRNGSEVEEAWGRRARNELPQQRETRKRWKDAA